MSSNAPGAHKDFLAREDPGRRYRMDDSSSSSSSDDDDGDDSDEDESPDGKRERGQADG